MLIKNQDHTVEIREKMRGGNGCAAIKNLVSKEASPAKCRLMAQISLEPGCSIGYHEHQGETEIFYFTHGCGTVNDNGAMVAVAEGDVVVTGNAGHDVTNTGDCTLIFTAVIILD